MKALYRVRVPVLRKLRVCSICIYLFPFFLCFSVMLSFRSLDKSYHCYRSVTQEHTGPHEFPYQNITSSQLGHFQNAIENATTQSDFEKLENCIKHGQIPRRQNQHRMEVALATSSETTMMLHSARDGVKGDPAEHHNEAAAPDPASVSCHDLHL